MQLAGSPEASTVNGERLERFYHHWFTSDTHVAELARELGTEDRIVYRPTRTGTVFRQSRVPTQLAARRAALHAALALRAHPARHARAARARRRRTGVRSRSSRRRSGSCSSAVARCSTSCGGRCSRESSARLRATFRRCGSGTSSSCAAEAAARAAARASRTIAAASRRSRSDSRTGFASAGGEVRTNEPVRELLVSDDGRVAGVRTDQRIDLRRRGARDACAARSSRTSWRRTRRTSTWSSCDGIPVSRERVHRARARPQPLRHVLAQRERSRLSVRRHHRAHELRAGIDVCGAAHRVSLEVSAGRIAELYAMSDDALLEFCVPHLAADVPAVRPELDAGAPRLACAVRAAGGRAALQRADSRHDTPLTGLFLCTMAQVYPEDRGTNYAIREGRRGGRRRSLARSRARGADDAERGERIAMRRGSVGAGAERRGSTPRTVRAADRTRRAPALPRSRAPFDRFGANGVALALIALWIPLQLLVTWPAPLTPAFDGPWRYDTSIFAYEGALVRQGAMPYLAFWDHKGPLIYLINAAGLSHLRRPSLGHLGGRGSSPCGLPRRSGTARCAMRSGFPPRSSGSSSSSSRSADSKAART